MEKCPHCERKFERLEDFPLIYVVKFERLEIPEIIPSQQSEIYIERKLKKVRGKPLPKEVLDLFQKSQKEIISHQGIVYRKLESEFYEVSKDITTIVKTAIETPEIQKTLNALESAVGKECRTLDLLDLPGFKKFKVEDDDYLSLSFYEQDSENSDARICRVNLHDREDIGSEAFISQDLAELSYEGRINK